METQKLNIVQVNQDSSNSAFTTSSEHAQESSPKATKIGANKTPEEIARIQEVKAQNYNGYNLKAFDSSKRLANFSPGPTCLPADVHASILKDLNDHEEWAPGVSPMEISHRSPEFDQILSSCETLMRQVYSLPEEFAMIWTHGGGHGQFAAVPLNLIKEEHKSASFIVNGAWSKKAMNESSKYIAVKEISNKNGLTPSFEERKEQWNLENCAFVYLCSNETVQGLEFRDFDEKEIAMPSREELGGVPLVVDMGSDVLSKRINWANVDVAFACCPKNFGIAGATVTFIRKTLIDIERKYENFIPTFMRWQTLYDSGCMYNTVPIFNIYVCNKVLEWMAKIGGVEEMERRAIAKSGFLYEAIDTSNGFYIAGQPKENKFRSRMNIPFTLRDESLNDKFLLEGFKKNIVGMKTKTPFGPGDIRVSMYNATEIEDARKLAAFMKEFAHTNQ